MKKKITFIIPNFDDGGAQRFFANLINSINKSKFEINLIVFNNNKSKYFKYIPQNIKVYDLHKTRVRYGLFELYNLIKKIKPDLIFSTLTQINLPLAFFKKFFFNDIKFIAREANIVSYNLNRYKLKWIWKILYKNLYKFFDVIICISQTQSLDLINNFNISRNKIKVIYNFVSVKTENINYDYNINKYFNDSKCTYFIAIGSLSIQKRFDRLIDSFNLIKESNFKLYIFGKGPLKSKLDRKIKNYNLNSKIKLMGYDDNVYKWLEKSDFFLISSDYEGLGSVLIESIYFQIPVLAYPIKGISEEILKDIDGCHYISTNSIRDFSFLLQNNMNKKYKLKKSYKDRFGVNSITLKYENLFSDLLS